MGDRFGSAKGDRRKRRAPASREGSVKVLIDHNFPFLLAHGGLQIQIERTKDALEQHGVEVDYLRWFDDTQRGDIIHFFGRAAPVHIRFAQGKGMKYVMSDLLTGQGSRSAGLLRLQGMFNRCFEAAMPRVFRDMPRWSAYREADAVLAVTPYEAGLMKLLFRADPERLHVVTVGIDEVFFAASDEPKEDYLVSTATIHPRKRNLETAQAAVAAGVRIVFTGKPYAEDDPYFLSFRRLVEANPSLLTYLGFLPSRADLAGVYRRARGFVLLSAMESLSASALEAVAAGCPLLLSDLPWARETFGGKATYCAAWSPEGMAGALHDFAASAPGLPRPSLPPTWLEVGGQILSVYRAIMGGPIA
jgi:glycosyltransferase involved in cell wall biosynthesis